MVQLGGEAQVLGHLSGEGADEREDEDRPEGDDRGQDVEEEPEQ